MTAPISAYWSPDDPADSTPPRFAPGAPAGPVAPERAEPASVWAGKLWSAVAAGDEYSALDTVRNAVDAGLDTEAILLDVIGAVQHRVGVEWAANRMSVAEEHVATAINDRAIASLPQHRPETVHGRVTVACVDGEWHALPARLLAEVLRLRGWHVDYLGAQVPSAHLITHLHRTGADVVALSSSLPTRLPTAHAVITACQAAGTPVIVGGAAFGPGGRYARRLGACGWAPDARTAADRLASGLPLRDGARRAADVLPHLLDQEYTLVKRNARQLVRDTFTGLADRYPAMAAYSDEQRERTAEDLAHIVDFLAAALYVDDTGLFTGFLTWTADILTAREVPAASLLPGLDLLHEQLRDFPRAQAFLAHGRTALTAVTTRNGSPA
ncbi:cobalamin B12-binding domain-containing protein [Streptomyces lavendofoliae]|uniref:cobalamin B12-binding domain-containing protein n=1 Tax=Streptomyces lavendofoliae TaxID=67314 RepID=UPI00300F3D36